MNYEELLPTYQKVRKVIRSCKTVAHLIVARKYAQLFMKYVPVARKAQMATQLNQLIKQRTRLLRL